MSDIKLFRLTGSKVSELRGETSDLEKPLQTLIENNLEALMGVRFLATEYSTGKTHAGRIDTLGLDENSCPVILEYKRSTGENVINQGLFYLDWLLDHKAEYKLLVIEKYSKEIADGIDWSAPRLICVAADFTKYDGHAVQQMNRNIELIRYRRFGSELLLLELVNAVSAQAIEAKSRRSKGKKVKGDKPVAEALSELKGAMRRLFDSLEGYLMSLGDDVQRKDLKLYIAFRRLKNFACVIIQKDKIIVTIHLDPEKVNLIEGFTRDVRNIGHWGTGGLEIVLKNAADLENAKPLLTRAYVGD